MTKKLTMRDQLQTLKDLKRNALVRSRKGELWMQEVKKDSYYDLIDDFNDCKRHLRMMIQVKKNPWYIHYVVGLYMLMTRPIKFLTIGRTNKKYFIDSYWELKKIKQEWDKEFEATQNSIDKDKLFIEKTDKWINKINNLVQKYGEKFYDAEVE